MSTIASVKSAGGLVQWLTLNMNDDENVLYGGPAPPPIDTEHTNLGDIFIKKFTEYGDRVLIVSEN